MPKLRSAGPPRQSKTSFPTSLLSGLATLQGTSPKGHICFQPNRNKILFEDFSGVFYEPNDDEEEEEETNTDKTSDMVFNQQWYWYSIVRMLAGEDIHKYSETYMLPMRTVLPEMSYLAQRNKIESARQRQQAAMRKL